VSFSSVGVVVCGVSDREENEAVGREGDAEDEGRKEEIGGGG